MGGILTTTTTTSSTTTTNSTTNSTTSNRNLVASNTYAAEKISNANSVVAAAATKNLTHPKATFQCVMNQSSPTWNVETFDPDYFYSNNLKLNVDVVLTHSREDTSCLEPSIDPSTGQSKGIVLYSSLRYQLRHCLKLSPLSPNLPCSLPQMLYMKVVLIGGTTKEAIGGVISPGPDHPNHSLEKVFASENRVQIEKVQSYKQLVHFKMSLYDLRDLNKAICELTSVEFHVFARKKQESSVQTSSSTAPNSNGSLSPKTRKTKNPSTKRSLPTALNVDMDYTGESFKRQKESLFDHHGSISQQPCYNNSISYSTSGMMNDLSFVSNTTNITTTTATSSSPLAVSANNCDALDKLINVALPSSPQEQASAMKNHNDQEEEDDDTLNLKIDDGEEVNSTTSSSPSSPQSSSNDEILLSQFCTLLNEMIQSIKSLNEQDRASALRSAVVALR